MKNTKASTQNAKVLDPKLIESARRELMNEDGFIEDPRFKQCNKEALIGVVVGIVNFVIWAVFGYGLGSGPVEEYTYVMGLPLWFFMSCIVTPAIIVALIFLTIDKSIKDIPLDNISEDEALEFHVKNNMKG